MTQSSPEVHQLIDDTLIRAAGGIVAKCTCGWVSRPYFSGMSASLTFREHQAGERADP